MASYQDELNKLVNKYKGEDEEVKKEIINNAIRFRANIILLKWIFDEMVRKIKDKYIGKTRLLSRECLYSILGTNRADYSKMINGHICMARTPMIEQVKSNNVMKDILRGTVLLKIGEMDDIDKWKSVFKNGNIDVLKKRMEESIKIWVDYDGEYLTKEEEACFTWLINSINDYLKGLNYYVEARVMEKMKAFRSLTFEELDLCTVETLDKFFADTQRVYKMITTIRDYKRKCKKVQR